uniref:Uncharacterized protein n=1 Tax=Panagrellus redivivus TaxID=6233 RepID=A0A7E4ZYK4_PANRE
MGLACHRSVSNGLRRQWRRFQYVMCSLAATNLQGGVRDGKSKQKRHNDDDWGQDTGDPTPETIDNG